MALNRRTGIIAGGMAMLAAGSVAMFMLLSPNVIDVGPGDDLQAAINSAHFGDTIRLKAGAVFDRATPLELPDKGTPPTGTDADYITITVDDDTAIPEKLRNYAPGNHPVITAAEAARMPKIRTTSPYPAINYPKGSKYYKLRGLDITNVDQGAMVPRLISGDLEEQISAYNQLPDHLIFELIYAHPSEETGQPLSAANINRTVENTIAMNATNVLVTKSAFQGFAGIYKYRETGRVITSANIMVTMGEHWRVENSLLQAWTYSFFPGGGGMPQWAVTEFATVSNCVGNPTTQCDFSNTTGLAVGEPVGMYVSTSTSAAKWSGAFVEWINGATVKFKKPLCQSFDGGNSCTPQNGTPANGDRVQWGGHQPTDYVFEWNTWEHPPEWKQLLGGCGGKGYAEFKSIVKLTLKGNHFKGCSGFTSTVRNQNGDFPWASLDGLTVIDNYFENGNSPFVIYGQDVLPTKRSRGITFSNNLIIDPSPNLSPDIPGGLLSLNFSNADDVTITHNTVPWKAWRMFNTFDTINNLRIQDNIFTAGQNTCLWGETTTPIEKCWVNAVNDHNLLVNLGSLDDLKIWWLNPWPNQFVVSSWDAVGFVRLNSALDKTGRYELAVNSPYKGKASDGSDPGVNYTQLIAGLRFDPNGGPVALPSPTASVSVSPSVSPSPIISPSPAVSPSPTGARIRIVSPANVRDGASRSNTTVLRIAQTGETGVVVGSCKQDATGVDVYCFVDFDQGVDGYVAQQFLTNVSASPSPTSTPAPTPSPTPTSTPTPTPSPAPLTRIEITAKVNIRSGPSVSSSAIGVANLNTRGWTTGTRLKDQFSALWFIFVGFDDGRSGFVADQFVRNR